MTTKWSIGTWQEWKDTHGVLHVDVVEDLVSLEFVHVALVAVTVQRFQLGLALVEFWNVSLREPNKVDDFMIIKANNIVLVNGEDENFVKFLL